MFKAIDVFSGVGGLSCGLIRSGFDVKVAIEIDHDTAATYKSYPPLSKTHVINKDIRNVHGEEIFKVAKIKKSELYLLAGCPPCQNFSSQNRLGNEIDFNEKTRLLNEFLRLVKEMYPPFILMENVPGLTKGNNKLILDQFISDLQNSESSDVTKQYHIIYGILNAADYSVPQSRKRFVLHAVRKDLKNKLDEIGVMFTLPKPTHSQDGEGGLKKWITVNEAIEDLPPIQAGEKFYSEKIKNHYAANLSPINLKRLEIIRKNGGSRNGLPDELKLECHKNHNGHMDVYGIMNGEVPSPTITCGCTSISKGRFGHPTQNRAISVREAARLQTFPDDFVFHESITKAAIQIGNAVPIKLVEASGIDLNRIMGILKKMQNKNDLLLNINY